MILGVFAGGQILVVLILLAIIFYAIYRLFKYYSRKAKEGVLNKILIRTFIVLFVAFVLLALPFHYVPSAGKVFPKANFTFQHTIITQGDIDDITKRYNRSSLMEKM